MVAFANVFDGSDADVGIDVCADVVGDELGLGLVGSGEVRLG